MERWIGDGLPVLNSVLAVVARVKVKAFLA
jgi:hypothetical protein